VVTRRKRVDAARAVRPDAVVVYETQPRQTETAAVKRTLQRRNERRTRSVRQHRRCRAAVVDAQSHCAR